MFLFSLLMIRDIPDEYDPIFQECEKQILLLYHEHQIAGKAADTFSRQYKVYFKKLNTKFKLIDTFTYFIQSIGMNNNKTAETLENVKFVFYIANNMLESSKR